MKQNFPLPPQAAALAARLSGRQRECLILVRNGLTSKEIARLLSLSPSTVDNHLNAATERLGCSSRAIAAQILEMAERFGDPALTGKETKTNKNSSENPGDATVHPRPQRSYFLPPFGGSPNEETAARRITHIGLIAITATMAFAAITITVAGVVELFSK